MIKFMPKREKSELDKNIDELHSQLIVIDIASEDYQTTLDHLKKLYDFRALTAPRQISPDTVIPVVGNIFGILLILHYERFNIVTSKALMFVKHMK